MTCIVLGTQTQHVNAIVERFERHQVVVLTVLGLLQNEAITVARVFVEEVLYPCDLLAHQLCRRDGQRTVHVADVVVLGLGP